MASCRSQDSCTAALMPEIVLYYTDSTNMCSFSLLARELMPEHDSSKSVISTGLGKSPFHTTNFRQQVVWALICSSHITYLPDACVCHCCKCLPIAGRACCTAEGKFSGQVMQPSHGGLSHGREGESSMLTASILFGLLLLIACKKHLGLSCQALPRRHAWWAHRGCVTQT